MINENAKKILDKLFADDPEDRAYVWVEVKSDLDERMYGSYRYITKNQLRGRKVEYKNLMGGKVGITVLDTTYNPKTFKWKKPL
jgi:hypothetical protein